MTESNQTETVHVHVASIADHLRPGLTPPVKSAVPCGVEPTYRTIHFRDYAPVNLLGRSDARRQILIIVDRNVWLAGNEADAGSLSGFYINTTNFPISFTTTGELWAALDPGMLFPATISYISEFIT